MPKLIDYPRTSYTGAWEVAEVVDDTGGKCALDTCARKLNRKVSGSFKAIVGSAVKFGLLTSKREMLATTTLFRRIKHAYDKQEELVFHREAFLTPPLFTQLCRKFRARELPVAMLDVLLIREFGVEEINAQTVAKAFVDGAHMVNLLDENNVVADIDQLAAQQGPRRELANPIPATNVFRQLPTPTAAVADEDPDEPTDTYDADEPADSPEPIATPVTPRNTPTSRSSSLPPARPAPAATTDAVASLFGFNRSAGPEMSALTPSVPPLPVTPNPVTKPSTTTGATPATTPQATPPPEAAAIVADAGNKLLFRIQLAGPGINTQLDVTDIDDLSLVRALLDKIERQLKR
ncbi:MAG: hypothetical protein ACRYFX_25390 [Janthinobacterium lividum]